MPVDLSRQIRSLVEVAAPVSAEEAIARHRLRDDSPEVCPSSGPARFIGLRSGAIAALAGLRLQGGSEEGEGPLALFGQEGPQGDQGALLNALAKAMAASSTQPVCSPQTTATEVTVSFANLGAAQPVVAPPDATQFVGKG